MEPGQTPTPVWCPVSRIPYVRPVGLAEPDDGSVKDLVGSRPRRGLSRLPDPQTLTGVVTTRVSRKEDDQGFAMRAAGQGVLVLPETTSAAPGHFRITFTSPSAAIQRSLSSFRAALG